jgi:potassium efflux system protein
MASNFAMRFILTALLAGHCLFSTDLLVAQESAQKAESQTVPATSDAPSLREVEAGLDAIENDSGMEDPLKNLLRPKYAQAIDALKAAAQFSAKTTEYRESVTSNQAANLRKQLNDLPSVDQAAVVRSTGSIPDLQKAVESKRSEADRLGDELTQAKTELARVKGRPAEISSRLPVAQREFADLNRQLESPDFAEDATSPTRTADRIVLKSLLASVQAELEMLNQEQASQAVREEVLQAQQELLTRQGENAAAALTALDAQLQERLTNDVQQFASKVSSLPLDAFSGDESLQAVVEEVQKSAVQFEEVVKNRKAVSLASEDLTARLNDLRFDFQSVRDQLALGGGGGAMVQVLFNLQRRASAAGGDVGYDQVPPLDETRLASIIVDDKLRGQAGLERQFAVDSSPNVAQLLGLRREILEKLDSQYSSLNRSLASLESNRRVYLDMAEEIAKYIAEQRFWLRSSPAIGVSTLRDIPAGLRWAFDAKHRSELADALRWSARQAPIRCIGILAIVTLLIVLRGRIISALEKTGIVARRISSDHYALTGEALLWTILLAAPLPLLIALMGWAIKLYPNPSGWLKDSADSAQTAAAITMATLFLAAVLRPGGLATAHFRSRKELVARYRQAIFLFVAVYVPATILTISYHLYGEATTYFDSVARIIFMLCHVWIALDLLRLFRAPDGVLATLAQHHPGRLMTRWRYFWCSIVVAVPLALVVLAAMGYLVTAIELSLGLLTSGVLVAGGAVCYALALRWFRIKYRRLALAEAIERRRASQEAATADEPEATDAEVVTIDEEDEQLDLEAMGDQTRAMLRLLFTLATATAVLVYWSNTFPLLNTLESWRLPLTGQRSVLELLQAVLIGIVTYFAVHNLPGLLELAVLRAKTLESGTRYAITTLCKYLLVAIGLGLIFGVLRVDWAKFGWIAAALSVGLGFGLQEVVANFVCGIILLFEQPIRVGDVVTIENTTGTVTKIRMRATTITNWDRHELVIPNKSLITNTLLNWTLSTSVNRIVIPIGIAYGSDTVKARQILLDAAAAHPLILDDPAPMATFDQFADSSLSLTLRAFLPDVDNRVSTITDLLTEIDRCFAEAGIEISFPQRDLHLRSGWGTAFPSGESRESANENDQDADSAKVPQPFSGETPSSS